MDKFAPERQIPSAATIAFGFILTVCAIIHLPAQSNTNSTELLESASTTTLPQSGSLLSINVDLSANLSSFEPLWQAAVSQASAGNHRGVAINVRAAELLTSAMVNAIEAKNTEVIHMMIRDKLGAFQRIKDAAHAQDLLAVLMLDGRLLPHDANPGTSNRFAFHNEVSKLKFRAPVSGLKWADGGTSPVLAVNDVTSPDGYFLINHEFALKYHRLFSAESLNDGNRQALASRWVSNSEDRQPVVTMGFDQPFQVERIKLLFESCHPCPSFKISLRVTEHRQLRGDWVDVYSIDNNSSSEVDIPLETPAYATEMRLNLYPESGELVRMQEIEIWVRTDRDELVNMAPLHAYPKVSSIMNAPNQQMAVIINGRVYSTVDAAYMQKSGVMLIPGQIGLLAVGDAAENIRGNLRKGMEASWFHEVRDLNATEAMQWFDVGLPLHSLRIRQSLPQLTAAVVNVLMPDALLLTGFALESSAMEISESARDSFTAATSTSSLEFPGSVMKFEKAATTNTTWIEKSGPLYPEWIAWRCDLTAGLLRDISNALAQGSRYSPLGLIIDSPLGDSHRHGLYWAPHSHSWSEKPAWFTAAFAAAGVGELLQFAAIDDSNGGQLFSKSQCEMNSTRSANHRLDLDSVSEILPGRPIYTIIPFEY